MRYRNGEEKGRIKTVYTSCWNVSNTAKERKRKNDENDRKMKRNKNKN